MSGPQKSSARRNLIRENRPDTPAIKFNQARCDGTFAAIGVAAVFWLLATAILMMREEVLPYRPGQIVRNDILSRVDFQYQDDGLRHEKEQEARALTPRVYRSTADKTGDVWQKVADQLLALPDKVSNLSYDQLPEELKKQTEPGSVAVLQSYLAPSRRASYTQSVNDYINQVRQAGWVIVPAEQRQEEVEAKRRSVTLSPGNISQDVALTFEAPAGNDLQARIGKIVNDNFRLQLQPTVLGITLATAGPTYVLDPDQTTLATNTAAEKVSPADCRLQFRKNKPIVHPGLITTTQWQWLRAENRAFLATLSGADYRSRAGVAAVVLLLTIAAAAYVSHYQPKAVKNFARTVAIAGLMLSMLLLAQLAGMGSGPIYWLAVAPTLLVGMILTIAYDGRFAVGLASIHAMLVTVGLDQRVEFLLIIWVGVISSCVLLGDVRSRSRLIEVGGVAALAMICATAAWGLVSLDPILYVANNCLYAGAAGLSVGFVVLGTLPFIEKSFRITTSMTLLELADASHPLLRRLSMEAPGTYSHSLQVATLSEAAAESVGGNSLLCRVAAYYHDVGKINKPDYFVENQQAGQQNRHINLNPSVSFLIIKGHVMDGLEMAREYMLPTRLFPFIQQHHGTTLVEYFYRAARTQQEQRGEEPTVSDTEFRYPGPKPRTKEVAILMLSDAVESATRAMSEPTAGRIESLVHDLTMKRLLDGQFDECDMTLRDLDRIEKSLVKTLLSIYHGRIPYPSTANLTASPSQAATA